jgi:hypothetical protein
VFIGNIPQLKLIKPSNMADQGNAAGTKDIQVETDESRTDGLRQRSLSLRAVSSHNLLNHNETDGEPVKSQKKVPAKINLHQRSLSIEAVSLHNSSRGGLSECSDASDRESDISDEILLYRTQTKVTMVSTIDSERSRISTVSKRELKQEFQRVKKWLSSIQMREYYKTFEDQHIWNLDVVGFLTKEYLIEFGIKKQHQDYMINEIKKLKIRNSLQQPSTSLTVASAAPRPRMSIESDLVEQKERALSRRHRASSGPAQVITVLSGVSRNPSVSGTGTSLANSRSSSRDSLDTTILNKPGYWDVFISHTQRNDQAKLWGEKLYASLTKLGYTCWLDVNMKNKSEEAMREGVQNSSCVVAIITGPCVNNDKPNDKPELNGFFKREYCLKELRWAIEKNIFIQPVVRTKDREQIGELMSFAPNDLIELQKIEFVSLDRSDVTYWDAGVKKICDKLKEETSPDLLDLYAKSRDIFKEEQLSKTSNSSGLRSKSGCCVIA